jgi:integrase
LVTEQINKVVPQKPELSIEQRQKLKGAIVEYMWNLQKNGASEDTYMPYSENLKFLVKNNADLFNPDDVKTVITFLNKTDIRKYNLVKAYKSFMNFAGIKGDLPTYSYIRTLPFIPLEAEIDQLITGCANYCKQMSIFLQLLKETGARAGEAYRLTWTDIDEVAKTISIRPEKGSNPRLNRISEKLLRLLISLQKTAVPDPKARVFAWKKKAYIGKSFRRMRKRIVANTGNQRLLKIHFHTLRYWKGTMVYIKTRSLAHVMVQLGHKSWSSAQLYVSLSEAIAQPDEKWITAVARTLEEALKLTNEGFVYDTDWEPGVKIYKKQVGNE